MILTLDHVVLSTTIFTIIFIRVNVILYILCRNLNFILWEAFWLSCISSWDSGTFVRIQYNQIVNRIFPNVYNSYFVLVPKNVVKYFIIFTTHSEPIFFSINITEKLLLSNSRNLRGRNEERSLLSGSYIYGFSRLGW